MQRTCYSCDCQKRVFHPSTTRKLIITGPDPYLTEFGVDAQHTAVKHEEAEIIMAHHMIHEASADFSAIRVVFNDVDVLVILVCHPHAQTKGLPSTAEVTMKSWSGKYTVLNVSEVASKQAAVIPNLPGPHSLTGCNAVSSFTSTCKVTCQHTQSLLVCLYVICNTTR